MHIWMCHYVDVKVWGWLMHDIESILISYSGEHEGLWMTACVHLYECKGGEGVVTARVSENSAS